MPKDSRGPVFISNDFVIQQPVHIGTSGWSYKDWKNVFYPAKLPPAEWLSYYAMWFDTTEINSSFYHLPRPQTPFKWAESVPGDFTFCPKISRYLTHMKKLHDPQEPLMRFFDIFDTMKDRLGPILIQLPPSLKYDEFLAANFFGLLESAYADYDFALEARHASWLKDEALSLLKRYHIAWVISQSGVGFPYAEHITSGNIYFRFHGPEGLYNSYYSKEQLAYYALKFKNWLKAGHKLWIYFNNDYYGYGIDNALTLKRMLGTL